MASLKQIWAHGNAFIGDDRLFDTSIRGNQITSVVLLSFGSLLSSQVVNLTNNYFQGPMPGSHAT